MGFSVLMSVYQNEKVQYFDRAIKSIWDDQTLKPDEIVLVKDGPLTPELEIAIDKLQAKLSNILRVISLEKNSGLGAALNAGLKHCSYELVARMDTDDISLPMRFEKQINFMEENPNIAVSSAYIEEFDGSGKKVTVRKLPLEHREIKKFAMSRSPLNHPVTIFRKTAIISVGGYPCMRIEDYALWSILLVNGYKFANLPDILLKMRTNEDFLHRRGYGFLKGEILLMQKQVKMDLYGWSTFFKNFVIRFAVRLSPSFLKRFFYKYMRG